MASQLLKQVRSIRCLEAAWRRVRSNGLTSQSEEVQRDIRRFDEDPSSNLRSLKSRLGHGSYKFPPARGVPIPKPNNKGIRPIVLADVESRIIQRALLDVLQGVSKLQEFFINPHSFGGVQKQKSGDLAAVPAAIKAVLDEIGNGARYIASADISSFFTRISKGSVTKIIADAVEDDDFMKLLRQAIHVDLKNIESLKNHADRFPLGDIGVAQGSALSPFLGNIILADFDRQMNEGDCSCIRYIDDFIILGPSQSAVASRLKRARRILDGLGMNLADGKTSNAPIAVGSKFEFLGIELNNGLIRPSSTAKARFTRSLEAIFEKGITALVGCRSGQAIPKSESLLGIFRRVDGAIQGWGKHYRFCNDKQYFKNIDLQIDGLIRKYLGIYSAERQNSSPNVGRMMLGIERLADIEGRPFSWPTKAPMHSTDLC